MTPNAASSRLLELLSGTPVIPVLSIADASIAEPLAEALAAGGLPVIEVTLRTDAALEAIRIMSRLPNCTVGAGTLLAPDQVSRARKAGARFGVSPGSTDALVAACSDENLPFLPGAATASEIMRLANRGFGLTKFFPAEYAGGRDALRAFSGPLPEMRFCPTGGIAAHAAPEYLKLPNVACVGGSWVAPEGAVKARDWTFVREAAAAAVRSAAAQ